MLFVKLDHDERALGVDLCVQVNRGRTILPVNGHVCVWMGGEESGDVR